MEGVGLVDNGFIAIYQDGGVSAAVGIGFVFGVWGVLSLLTFMRHRRNLDVANIALFSFFMLLTMQMRSPQVYPTWLLLSMALAMQLATYAKSTRQ
jgi:hypothetical protein